MPQLSTRIKTVYQKVEYLREAHRKLRAEYLDIVEERDNLRKKTEQQAEKVQLLENQLKMIKLSRSSSLSKEENKELRDNLEDIIQEIDRCINMLSNE